MNESTHEPEAYPSRRPSRRSRSDLPTSFGRPSYVALALVLGWCGLAVGLQYVRQDNPPSENLSASAVIDVGAEDEGGVGEKDTRYGTAETLPSVASTNPDPDRPDRAAARGPSTTTANPMPPKITEPRRQSEAARLAVAWLDGKLTAVRPDADGRNARWIDSYDGRGRVGWTYDAALAVLAYLAVDRVEVAQELLHGLEMLQADDGGWPFSFDPDTGKAPSDAPVYVGSMAWVVIAANTYEETTADRRFAAMARHGLRYILRFRVVEPGAPNVGAVAMGPPNPRAYSVEHNVDCYVALIGRSRLDDHPELLEVAAAIRQFVMNVTWDEVTLGPDDGFFRVGYRDNSLYLDAQTWTVLAFAGRADAEPRLDVALDTAIRHLETRGELGGVTDIVGFNETADWIVSDKVWAEGSEGMVTALRRVGRHALAAAYHRQTRRYQTGNGGVPYATDNADAWPTEPGVASTVWFLFNELNPPFNPFAATD